MIWNYRERFAKAVAMVLISNSLLILNPLVLRKAISTLSTVPFRKEQAILLWAFLLFMIAAASAYFKYLMRIEFIAISRDVEREVRLRLFERIQSQSKVFYDSHGIGELLSRLTNDISSYRDVIGPGIMYPAYFFTLVLPGFIALFTISSYLAVLSLIPLLLIPLVNAVLRRRIYQLSLAVQEFLGKMSSMVQEHYSGIRIIKGYGVETFFFKQFANLCRPMAALSTKLSRLQGVFFPFFTLLTKLVTVSLVLSAGILILQGMNRLSAADFVSFMWIQSYIFFPILMLAWVLPIYERGRAAYARLVEIYEEPIEVKTVPNLGHRIQPKANIIFKNLTFTYPRSTLPVISQLNLTINCESFVGITGPVGSGKTTIFRLLNREYEIPRGMLFIGDRDIHDYDLDAFSQSMATVEQIPFIFSRSIAENVRFGREEASLAEIETVARHVELHEDVQEFPEQYETLVGERGVTLSGGQKQRVAMARAFLVNRSILLLDDIFSSVDAETENRIFRAMRQNFKGKTILLISNRISILDRMDRIIYFEKGKIVEDGIPSELIAKNGYYAALRELNILFQKNLS